MNPKIIYPIPDRQSTLYRNLRSVTRIVFILAAFVCLLVNILVKGKPWSLIVIWSLFCAWRLFFSLRLVEFSIFAHTVKITLYIVVLLYLIDRFLAPGWGETVIPIVLFGDLLIMLVVFLMTYDRKERHVVSITMLGLINLAMIPYSLHSWPITNWIAFAFLCASSVLFIVLLIINRKQLIHELKVRFNINTK
ncbi:MAG: hypothetical protein IK151_04960 [Erysipelotrichaceae bacterium]|nr:hypothetical protein [Erysipelotrichaceae bacterium]